MRLATRTGPAQAQTPPLMGGTDSPALPAHSGQRDRLPCADLILQSPPSRPVVPGLKRVRPMSLSFCSVPPKTYQMSVLVSLLISCPLGHQGWWHCGWRGVWESQTRGPQPSCPLGSWDLLQWPRCVALPSPR